MAIDSTELAAGLESAFAARGFAEPGVDELRAAADVSLRTLYKYFPSREAMVLAALEHRHERYMAHLFDELPKSPQAALDATLDRVATWMRANAPRGCLFHSAVAAHPENESLRALLARHKGEMADRMAKAAALPTARDDLLVLHEGLTQSWSLLDDRALIRVKSMARQLNGNEPMQFAGESP